MKKGKGQSTLEFAVVTLCIAAALISMTAYIKRGIQGRLRQVADEISQRKYTPKNTKPTTQNPNQPTSSITFNAEKEIKVYREQAKVPVEVEGVLYEGDYIKREDKIKSETNVRTINETVD